MSASSPAPVGSVAVAAGPIGTRLGDVDGNFERAASVIAKAAGKSGAGESGAGESGAGKSGAGKSGAGKSGAGKSGAGKSGAAESRAAEKAAGEKAAGDLLIVLPELATSGYAFRSRAEAADSSVTADDPRWQSLSRALRPGAVVVIGFAERDGDTLFSSAAVVEPDGVAAVYRKTHLWGDESLFFSAGNTAPPVVETSIGRIGVAICYDGEFPEVPRSLALRGADVLALPVNWPRVERPHGERPPETILAMAAARASRLPVVVADRSGYERGIEWTDGSAVVGPDGWLLSPEPGGARGQGLSTARLDLRAARDKRVSRHNDLLRDRRPDLYDLA